MVVYAGRATFNIDEGEGSAFVRAELETEDRCSREGGVQETLEGGFFTSHEDQVISVGQTRHSGVEVGEDLITWEGGCLLLDAVEDKFQGEVE